MWDIAVLWSIVPSCLRSSSAFQLGGYLLLLCLWRFQGVSSSSPSLNLAGEEVDSHFDNVNKAAHQWPCHDCTSQSASTAGRGNSSSTTIPTSGRSDQSGQEQEDAFLLESVPGSTGAERQRFLLAENGSVDRARERLEKYVAWTTKHQQIQKDIRAYDRFMTAGEGRERFGDDAASICGDDDDDHDDWYLACAAAVVARKEPTSPTRVRLPRVARTFSSSRGGLDPGGGEDGGCCRCRDGYRIIHIAPGKLDDRLVALETYSLAIALYIDRKLHRDTHKLVTVMIDARGGVGWRNPHATELVPFIQHTSELLLSMFPERLGRAIVYPVPWCLSWIWTVVRCCLDPKTCGKIHLLGGPAKITSPPPREQLALFVSEDLSDRIEAERVSSFVYQDP